MVRDSTFCRSQFSHHGRPRCVAFGLADTAANTGHSYLHAGKLPAPTVLRLFGNAVLARRRNHRARFGIPQRRNSLHLVYEVDGIWESAQKYATHLPKLHGVAVRILCRTFDRKVQFRRNSTPRSACRESYQVAARSASAWASGWILTRFKSYEVLRAVRSVRHSTGGLASDPHDTCPGASQGFPGVPQEMERASDLPLCGPKALARIRSDSVSVPNRTQAALSISYSFASIIGYGERWRSARSGLNPA